MTIGEVLASLILGGFLAFVYFSPTLIAQSNEHRRTKLIFLLNVAIGWTIIGWLILLLWAFLGD